MTAPFTAQMPPSDLGTSPMCAEQQRPQALVPRRVLHQLWDLWKEGFRVPWAEQHGVAGLC